MGIEIWKRRNFIAAASTCVLGGCYRWAWAAPARTLLIVGDSLSAEYGLRRGEGWVALLERRLAERKLPVNVVNASISGDTTAGGVARLPALLVRHKPDVVVIELCANDALRGLPLPMTEQNLSRMVEDAQKAGARVLLVGTQLPPNYGTEYAKRYVALFPKVAKTYKVPFVRSLLTGIGDAPDTSQLFQADRLHPNARAQPRMLENVWPELKKLLA